MVEYPDEIEAYKNQVNSMEGIKENNLRLVSASMDSLKTFLVIFCILFIVIGGVYIYLVSQGYEKPVFTDFNNISIENNFTIQNNINFTIENRIYMVSNNSTYYNITYESNGTT